MGGSEGKLPAWPGVLEALLWGGPGTLQAPRPPVSLQGARVAPRQDGKGLTSREHATMETRAGTH